MKISFSRRRLVKVLLLGLVIVTFVWVAKLSSFFPLQKVIVVGAYQQVLPEEIQDALEPVEQTTFFRLDLKELQQSLLALPWISSVELRRVWPDTLRVKLTEKEPRAYWNQVYVLMVDGELLTWHQPLSEPLPHLYGPEGKYAEVWQIFQKMSDLVQPLDLSVTRLELSLHDTWVLELSSETTLIVGSGDFASRLERFVEVYPQIVAEHGVHPKRVDLRYPHGLAVRWNEDNAKEA